MYGALSATSLTLADFLRKSLAATPLLKSLFDTAAGGTFTVSLNNPEEMSDENRTEGLSVWLYRIVRDDQTLNAPPVRIDKSTIKRTPLPFRLHYLITPLVNSNDDASPETEQRILGRVLQALYDRPALRGTDLQDDFGGTSVELNIRLEPLSLEEMTRVWDALDRSYQLSVSYEVTVVCIESGFRPEKISQVETVMTDYGVIVSSEEA